MKLLESIRQASRDNGKSALRQLKEIAQLRFSSAPLGVGEYFDYGIYKNGVVDLRSFIGWRDSAALDKSFNDNYSRVLANDKLLNYLVLHSAGFPIPQPIASYTMTGRQIAGELVLRTIQDVCEFLEGNIYPFYVKPISAGYGRGVFGVSHKDGDRLVLMDRTWISIDDFLKPFLFQPFRGMLFQRPLRAHSKIAELTGSAAVCCVRCICFVTPSGPIIHTAFWKIAVGNNMLDNFSHGDYGNCLAAVNVEDGSIVRAISKIGPGGEIHSHPTTGKPLIGFRLPDWQALASVVTSAANHFPGLRLQNWDVALCPDGPILLELNTESELAVPQAISGRGLNDQRLRNIIDEIQSEDLQHKRALTAQPKSVLPIPSPLEAS